RTIDYELSTTNYRLRTIDYELSISRQRVPGRGRPLLSEVTNILNSNVIAKGVVLEKAGAHRAHHRGRASVELKTASKSTLAVGACCIQFHPKPAARPRFALETHFPA